MTAKKIHAANGYEKALVAVQVKTQGGKCPVCGTRLAAKGACSDHDHETGLARGALCRLCNTAEGALNQGGITRYEYAMKYQGANRQRKSQRILQALISYRTGWSEVHREVLGTLAGVRLSTYGAAEVGMWCQVFWGARNAETDTGRLMLRNDKYQYGGIIVALDDTLRGLVAMAEKAPSKSWLRRR